MSVKPSTVVGVVGGVLLAAGAWRYYQTPASPLAVAKANSTHNRRSAIMMLGGPYQQGLFVGDALANPSLSGPWDAVTAAVQVAGGLVSSGVSASQTAAQARAQQQLAEQQAAIAAAQAQAAQAQAAGASTSTLYWVGGGIIGIGVLGSLGLIGYKMAMKR